MQMTKLEGRIEGALANHRVWSAGSVAVIASLIAVMFLFASPARAAMSWHAGGRVSSAGTGPLVNDVACPLATQCTAVDSAGRALTFDPGTSAPPTAASVNRGQKLQAVSCPSAHQCSALGDQRVVTFDPGSPEGDVTIVPMSGYPGALDCPSVRQCTAVASGRQWTFNPTDPSPARAVVFDPTPPKLVDYFSAVSCPTETRCAVVRGPTEVTFDPQDATGAQVGSLDVGPQVLNDIACLSASQCVGSTDDGRVLTFNPANPAAYQGTVVGGSGGLAWLSCPTTSRCVGVTGSGERVTFDPALPSSHTQQSLGSQIAGGLGCASTSRCVAISFTSVLGFDPGANAAPTTREISVGYPVSDPSCPSENYCVAVNGNKIFGFDPANIAPSVTVAALGPDENLGGLVCTSVSQCTATGSGSADHILSFNPSSPGTPTDYPLPALAALSCPAATQCTAFAFQGGAGGPGVLTFNPASPGAPAIHDLGGFLMDIACPSTTQCTAVTNAGRAYTFNPVSPGSPPEQIVIPADRTAEGEELWAVSCPTSSQCTATDGGGRAWTFNPGSGPATESTVLPGAVIADVTCPTTTACFATDFGGEILEGNPLAEQPWTPEPIAGAGELRAVACPTVSRCVAGDNLGNIFTGEATAIVGAPQAAGGPRIVGDPVQGAHLSAVPGAWSNAPVAHLYQWKRCSPAGASCVGIRDAIGSAYVPTSADVGSTIRVQETASNSVGTSPPVTSAASGLVQAAPTGTTPPVTGVTSVTVTPPVPTPTVATAAQIRALLSSLLTPGGKAAKIKALLKAGAFRQLFKALTAGRATVNWYQLPPGVKLAKKAKPVLVASGAATFTGAGTTTIKITLTSSGKRLLKHAKRLNLTAQGTFKPTGQAPVTTTKAFTLKK